MVAIKNAVVPPSCYFCPMTNNGFYLCKANNPYKMLEEDCEERRPDWCPLVPVPTHGRLIDSDELTKEMRLFINENMLSRDDARELLETIADAPTIIPASEEGET